MSDSEDLDAFDLANNDYKAISKEINRYKSNPETAGMFVSGWDDDDEGIEAVQDPKANPVDYILWAAENGEVEIIKELLETKPGLVHSQDSDGYSPLHRAAYGNHLEACIYLLSKGAKVSNKTEVGWTPLHSACNWNNYQIVARLLSAGSDPAAQSDGAQTPMHLAAAISHCKSSLLILLMREDTVEIANSKNNSRETPKELALRHGIYGPLFEMVLPAASYIRSQAFTCNPYIHSNKKFMLKC